MEQGWGNPLGLSTYRRQKFSWMSSSATELECVVQGVDNGVQGHRMNGDEPKQGSVNTYRPTSVGPWKVGTPGCPFLERSWGAQTTLS